MIFQDNLKHQFECSICEWNDSFWLSEAHVRSLDTQELSKMGGTEGPLAKKCVDKPVNVICCK